MVLGRFGGSVREVVKLSIWEGSWGDLVGLLVYCVSRQNRYRYLPMYAITLGKSDSDLPVYSIARADFD